MDWWKWDETWTIKCGLKKIRWNMNNDIDNVTIGKPVLWWMLKSPKIKALADGLIERTLPMLDEKE